MHAHRNSVDKLSAHMVVLKPNSHGICDIYRAAVPEGQSSLAHILEQMNQAVLSPLTEYVDSKRLTLLFCFTTLNHG